MAEDGLSAYSVSTHNHLINLLSLPSPCLFIWHTGVSGWVWDAEYHEFGHGVQNSSCSRKMCGVCLQSSQRLHPPHFQGLHPRKANPEAECADCCTAVPAEPATTINLGKREEPHHSKVVIWKNLEGWRTPNCTPHCATFAQAL
jgi:hypothetical protein